MIRFSTVALMDEQKCYDYLVEILHPKGLCCPKCETPVEQSKVHRRDRDPIPTTSWRRTRKASYTQTPRTHRGAAPIKHGATVRGTRTVLRSRESLAVKAAKST
jgi:hypothetical protein